MKKILLFLMVAAIPAGIAAQSGRGFGFYKFNYPESYQHAISGGVAITHSHFSTKVLYGNLAYDFRAIDLQGAGGILLGADGYLHVVNPGKSNDVSFIGFAGVKYRTPRLGNFLELEAGPGYMFSFLKQDKDLIAAGKYNHMDLRRGTSATDNEPKFRDGLAASLALNFYVSEHVAIVIKDVFNFKGETDDGYGNRGEGLLSAGVKVAF
jgi:hypothetical protein